MEKKFRITELGDEWLTDLVRAGRIFTESELRDGWEGSLKNWDGTLKELNYRLSKNKRFEFYVQFEEVLDEGTTIGKLTELFGIEEDEEFRLVDVDNGR